jgi:hypothetical protein
MDSPEMIAILAAWLIFFVLIGVVIVVVLRRSARPPAPPPDVRPAPRADLAYRARTLAAAGRESEAVLLITTETGMSAPEARTFLHALLEP